MALLDRCRERIETDLGDPELQRLIDEALTAVIARHGPHADPLTPLVVTLAGVRQRVALARPIDTAEAVVVAETVGTTTTTTLAVGDYRVWHGGRVLERLSTGTNPRATWGSFVRVTYVPVADGNERQETVIQLVQLAIATTGVKRESVGDVDITNNDYGEERERLLRSLAPLPIPR